MDDEIKNVDNLVRFWRESSDQNYTTMHNLYLEWDKIAH
jgi:hypothetical protein